MILCIDIGNTHSVFGLVDDQRIVKQWRIATPKIPHADHWRSTEYKEFEIIGIIVCSVVPRCDIPMTQFCTSAFDLEPFFITSENAGIPIDLETPQQIGADRIVNAASVIAYHKTPAIVIDFGTATTFDVIGDDGTYLGGMIAPGIKLSLKALTDAASKLETVPITKPPNAIGKTTEHAMQAGLFYGYKGVIETCVAEISKELNAAPSVIATGGLGRLFYGETDTIHTYDPDLTLQGLAHLYKTLA